MEHEGYCVKLKKQLPGLDEPPFDTELGQKIYENVSQEAWRQWTEFCKMILNEYRLNPARRSGSHRPSHGAVFLRRRRGRAQGIRPTDTLNSPSKGYRFRQEKRLG